MAYGPQNSGQLLSIASIVDDVEIYKKLVNLYRDNDYMKLMRMMGAWTKTKQPRYNNLTESPLINTLDLTGTTVTNSGTPLVTVAGLPLNSTLVGKMYRDSTGSNYARVQTVTVVGGTSLTITLRSMTNTNLTVTTNTVLSFGGNGQEEGSFGPGSERWPLANNANKVQIHKLKVEATDIAKAKEYRIDFTDENGKAASGYVNYEQVRGYMAHNANIAAALWAGDMSLGNYEDPTITGTVLGAKGNVVQSTRGIDSYVRNFGNVLTAGTLGTFATADLAALNDALEGDYGPTEYLLMGGQGPMQVLYNYFKNLGSSGVQSARMIIEGREVDLTVDTVHYANRTFYLTPMSFLSNNQLFAPQDPARKSVYAIPLGNTTTQDRDGETGSTPYMSVKYMPIKGYGKGDEKIAEWHTGALAPQPTSDESIHGITYQTIAGLELLAPEKTAVIRLTA